MDEYKMFFRSHDEMFVILLAVSFSLLNLIYFFRFTLMFFFGLKNVFIRINLFMKNFFGSSWVKLHPTGTPSRLNQTLILQVDLGQVLAQTHLDPVSVFCHLQLQSRILSCQSSPHPPLHPGSVEPPSTRSEHQTSTMMDLSDLLKPVETVRTEVSIYHLSWMKNHNQ